MLSSITPKKSTESLSQYAGSRFLATYAVAGAIVFYQLITASISEVHPYTMSQQRGIMIGVLLLLFLVLLTPIGSGSLKSRPAPLPTSEDNSWCEKYIRQK